MLTQIKSTIRKINYFAESLIVRLVIGLFKILGPQKSSNFGSFLARFIGKKISVQNLARSNIAKALPDLSKNKIEKILDGMWDNLGRIVGEFIHISKCNAEELNKYLEFDEEILENIKFIQANHRGGIIFSAHIGNWEVGSKFFTNHGFKIKILYRPMNNNVIDDLITSIRGAELIAKGPRGNKQIIQEIKNGNYVVILADHKSPGKLINFLNRPALTSTAIARIALKYNVPLIPARSIRIGKKFKFKIEIEKPIEFSKTDQGEDVDATNLMIKINKKMESWIKEYPAQWFWVHNRWKK